MKNAVLFALMILFIFTGLWKTDLLLLFIGAICAAAIWQNKHKQKSKSQE